MDTRWSDAGIGAGPTCATPTEQLAKLSPQHVQAMMNAQRKAGLSPCTVRYIWAIERRALGHALKWGLVGRNVAALVDPAGAVRTPVAPLSANQARACIAQAAGDRLGPLSHVAVASGSRQAERFGLRWDDVDLSAGIQRVRHAPQPIDGELR